MKIHSLYYKNLLQDWELEEVHFSDLNVLVGISGAGKTQIVNAIQNLAEIANGRSDYTVKWKIKFSIKKNEYVWEGHSKVVYIGGNKPDVIHYLVEKLTINSNEIISQDDGKINYKNQILPKIGSGESLIRLLNESEIAVVRNGFKSIIHKDFSNYQEESMLSQTAEQLLSDYNNEREIQNSLLPLIIKFYILKQKFPVIFEQIKNNYIEIFPQVAEILVGTSSQNGKDKMMEILLKIDRNPRIIPQSEISSGMFRTLMAIVELYLCHEESLFLLDEFENSLGFNCLDKMFELIENKAYSGENQFILTTHNPYIIRNADLSAIKIVTRKGNKIIVKNAIDMGLAASAQDNFFKIINLKEFREGVSA